MQTIFLYEKLTKELLYQQLHHKIIQQFYKNLKSTQPQIIHCSKLMWIKTNTLCTQKNRAFSFYNL